LKPFPGAPADLATQHLSVLRKAAGDRAGINASIAAEDLLRDLIHVHLENVAAGACASYMRTLSNRDRVTGTVHLVRQSRGDNPFRTVFSLLLHRETNPTEDRILETLGTIQIHHGSAGSNMVARYLSPLFEAIDAGRVHLSSKSAKRIAIVQRMYQLAFVEGIEKAGRTGRLRVAPNTDFGGWIVQEALGIDERDRTFLSYAFRGFG